MRYLGSDIAAQARRIERVFREKLAPLAQRPCVKELRILGAVAAVELQGEVTANAAAMEDGMPATQAIRRRMLDAGILIRPLGNVIYLMPPLTIPDDDFSRLCDALIRAVAG